MNYFTFCKGEREYIYYWGGSLGFKVIKYMCIGERKKVKKMVNYLESPLKNFFKKLDKKLNCVLQEVK